MKSSKLTKDEAVTKQSYDKLAKQWSDAHLTPGYWEEEIVIFNQFLPKGKLLEVGCGGGRDARELIKLGYSYVGTDISKGLLNEARKNNPGAEFKQVSLYDLDFPDKFDGFWCAAVLLHIPKKRIVEALIAIKRNLKPGAVGFIAVKQGKGEKLEVIDRISSDKRFFALWQTDELKTVLIANGFKILHPGRLKKSYKTTWLTFHVSST